MRVVDIDQLKDHIAEYVNCARSGETVLIRDRDTTVAHLIPPVASRERGDAGLTAEEQELVAAGLMRPREHLLSVEKLRNMPREFLLPENSGIRAILEDRNEGL
jgi:antitoxin (DNA-binding transcriptional repressor) of toxin-antitoxin stability system